MKLLEGVTGVIILPLVLGSRWDRRGIIEHVYAGAPVNNITVSADDLVQCSEATISWTNTKPPVEVRVGIGGYYVGIDWLDTLQSDDDSITWTVDQPSGTDLIFQVKDAVGELAYVQNQKVQESDDDSCLNSNSTAAASSAVSDGGAVGPESMGSTSTQGDDGSASTTSQTDSASSTSSSRSKSKSKTSSDPASQTPSSSATSATRSSTSGSVTPAVAGGVVASSTLQSSALTASALSGTTSGASSLSVELPFSAVNGLVTLLLIGVSVMIWL